MTQKMEKPLTAEADAENRGGRPIIAKNAIPGKFGNEHYHGWIFEMNQTLLKSTCPECKKKYRKLKSFAIWEYRSRILDIKQQPDWIMLMCKKCWSTTKDDLTSGAFATKLKFKKDVVKSDIIV